MAGKIRENGVTQEFNSLPQVEQLADYDAIVRKVTPADYGPLSDVDLTAIAAETVALLDQEEIHQTKMEVCFAPWAHFPVPARACNPARVQSPPPDSRGTRQSRFSHILTML
jgi:hypothetical protein